jgi:ribonuclease HI
MIWNLYFDGAIDPNPGGVMAWGYVVDAQDGSLVTGKGSAPALVTNSNNVAEYYGLGHGVRRVVEMLFAVDAPKFSGLHIRGDSQLVCNQVNRLWAVKSPALAPLHGRVLDLLTSLPQPWVLEWVPREQNGLADELSKKAFMAATGRKPREYAKAKS